MSPFGVTKRPVPGTNFDFREKTRQGIRVVGGEIAHLLNVVRLDDDGLDIEISTGIVETGTDWRRALLSSYLVAATTSRSYERQLEQELERIPAPTQETTP